MKSPYDLYFMSFGVTIYTLNEGWHILRIKPTYATQDIYEKNDQTQKLLFPPYTINLLACQHLFFPRTKAYSPLVLFIFPIQILE